MTKQTKLLLTIALACLVIGFPFLSGLVNVRDAIVLYAIFPTGATFLGLFLVSLTFEKETARYDAEQHALSGAADDARTGTTPASPRATRP